ncbi:hypothetical protein WMY93_020976 [Mugilogobius chulae]|uniref:RING-type E3 ubiquitin transferase n=1 Tax=Mugilogobius chulae TaxID=88201 RepID=A0AAW0NF69_9GOBI
MEDGQTLFDYNVGLNDIVQLLIRAQADSADSPDVKNSVGDITTSASAISLKTNKDNNSEAKPNTSNQGSTKNGFAAAQDLQPPTSSRCMLINAGIGVYKINELVDCRDVSIGAWFEACIENVTLAPPKPKMGRPSKRTNGKLDSEQGQGQNTDSNRTNNGLNPETNGATTSQTDSAAAENRQDVIYHIKYEDYPENGVVEMLPCNVRPRARTLLRWDQLQEGMVVMVNYNMETPEERGFWFDAEVQTLNQVSRTNKELRVKILIGGPLDVVEDCKIHFLDEIYQVEKQGARALSAGDGQFKRKSGPECKHCKADPDASVVSAPAASAEEAGCPHAAAVRRVQHGFSHLLFEPTAGMACVGRTKECTIVPRTHYGPVPGIPVGTTWKFRVQTSRGWDSGRSHDGSYSLVLAGVHVHSSGGRDLSGNKRIGEHSFDQTLTHNNSVVKYWPEVGKCGLSCVEYLLRRDDTEPAPWTPEGLERTKKLGLKIQKRGHCQTWSGRKNNKRFSARSRSRRQSPPKEKVENEEEEDEEAADCVLDDDELISNDDEQEAEDGDCLHQRRAPSKQSWPTTIPPSAHTTFVRPVCSGRFGHRSTPVLLAVMIWGKL